MFSVAEQRVVDPATGTTVVFAVDPADSAIVHCIVGHAESNDYLRLDFQRNGGVTKIEAVDAEVEADQKARREAELRLARGAQAPTSVAEEDRQKANEAAAKQAEDDKALLASPPKVSKFEKKEASDGGVKANLVPA